MHTQHFSPQLISSTLLPFIEPALEVVESIGVLSDTTLYVGGSIETPEFKQNMLSRDLIF